MKHFIGVWVWLLLAVFVSKAQSGRGLVRSAEVFFDADPGQGNGISLNFNPGIDSSFRAAVQAITPGLSNGLHTVNVRFRDGQQNWGPVFKTTLLVENPLLPRNIGAILARAFWNNDSTLAQPMIIFNGNAGNALNTFVNATSLASFAVPGLQRLNVQVMGADGKYGPRFSTMVNVEQELFNPRTISAAIGRAYWNNNPGQSIGMVIFNGNAGNAFNTLISTGSLPTFPAPGLHKLNVQLLDPNMGGSYGPLFTTIVKVDEELRNGGSQKVSEGRVWLNNNPPPAIGNFLASDGSLNDAVEATYQTLTITTPGLNKVNVQLRDSANGWGPVFSTVTNVEQPIIYRNINIAAARMWWNTSNNYIMLVSFNGNFTSAIETVLNDTIISAPVVPGYQTLNVQVQDVAGNWCNPFKTIVVVERQRTARGIRLVQGEVQIDNNAPVSLLAADGSFSDAVETIQSSLLSGSLAAGLHTLRVRVKGTGNNWGPYFTRALLVSPCATTPLPVVSVSGAPAFCKGDSVILTANTGFASYTWIRDNTIVGSSRTLVARDSGSYRVVVTDTTNCPNTSSALNITVYNPVVTIAANATFCQGTTDSLIATPGFASYQWSAGSQINRQFITAAGSYTVTATDANGCTATASTTMNMLPAPTAPVINASGPLTFCPGGSVTLSTSLTSGYQWSNGVTGASFTTDTSGVYTLTVTAANGCRTSSTRSVIRFSPAQASIQLVGPQAYCVNQPSHLFANDSCQYQWSTGATTQGIQPSVSGVYTVTVTNLNGCTATAISVPLTVHPLPAIPVISASGPLTFCNGNSVTLSSTPGLTHMWSNGSTTASIVVTQSAILTDTVFSTFGCKSWSAPVQVTVTPSASITASGPTTICSGDTVLLTAQPATGVSYIWQNGATTRTITLNATTAANVIVTEDGTGCRDTAYTNVVVNPLPTGTISANGPTRICSGTSMTISASGSPHTKFQWFLNGSPITSSPYSLSCGCYVTYNIYGYTYAAAIAGVYTALAIDTITGCTQFTNPITLQVQAPSVPVIAANGGTTLCINQNTLLSSSPSVSYLWSNGATTQTLVAATAGIYTVTTTDDLGCTATSIPTQVTFYPTAVITPSGSTSFCVGASVNLTAQPAGTYQWSNGATAATINGINTSGTFRVTVTDINGCSSVSAPVSVTVNALPAGAIAAAGPTTFCSGAGVTLTTTGSPHTIFKWFLNGNPILYMFTNVQVTGYSYFANQAGSYNAIVYDTITGCSSYTNTINVIVNPLPNLQIIQTTQVLCYGSNEASLQATGSGTTGPYSYAWSNGGSGSVQSSLFAGSYIALVTDNNGCSMSDTIAVTQPSPVSPVAIPSIYAQGNNVSCAGGSNGSLAVSAGGTPPYSYLWSTGSISPALSGLPAATYTVTVTDSKGCTGSTTATLIQPSPFQISLLPSVYTGGFNIDCMGRATGTLTFSSSGGTGAMSQSWSTGEQSATITHLAAGVYAVTVSDSSGCTAQASIQLTEPSAIQINKVISQYNGYNISCNHKSDGFINLSVGGGVPGYRYSWSDTVYSANRSGIKAGTYIIQVTDTNGCISRDTIVLTEPDSNTLMVTGSMLTCYGDNNGTTHVSAVGNYPPFTYQWSNGVAAPNAGGLSAGLYLVTATDSRGCTNVQTAEVRQPQELTGYAFGTYIDCGTQIGLLSITATGGTAPYSFQWSNGSTASFQTNIPVGNYSVTVTDSNGCKDTALAIILNPPDLFATVSNAQVQCENSTDGTLTVVASQGVPPYMYLWSNGATTPTISNLSVGNYTVIVTDANGCTVLGSPSVTPIITLQNHFTTIPACAGGADTIKVTSSGGTAPYSYVWNTGAVGSSINGTLSGTYTVTATDAIGCIGTDSVVFSDVHIIAGGPTVFCTGDSVVLTASGGTNHLWSNGATTASITVFSSGNYTLAANGCNVVDTMPVLVTYCEQTVGLKIYIEGFYNPATDNMVAAIDPVNLPLICDSVSVLLVDAGTLLTAGTVKGLINTAGIGSFFFNALQPGRNYYIVVRHRNSVETWSKQAFMFLSPSMNFDFTKP